MSDRMGSIDVGKIANLVVTDGDLFDEKTKIKMVFVDGRRFETHEPKNQKIRRKATLVANGSCLSILHTARKKRPLI